LFAALQSDVCPDPNEVIGCDVDIAIASMTSPVAERPENVRLAGEFWAAVLCAVPNVPICAAPE